MSFTVAVLLICACILALRPGLLPRLNGVALRLSFFWGLPALAGFAVLAWTNSWGLAVLASITLWLAMFIGYVTIGYRIQRKREIAECWKYGKEHWNPVCIKRAIRNRLTAADMKELDEEAAKEEDITLEEWVAREKVVLAETLVKEREWRGMNPGKQYYWVGTDIDV